MCHISHLGLLLHGHLPTFKLWFVLIVTMIISNFFSERYFSRWQLRCSWFCMVVVLKPIWETLFSILSECKILKSMNYCYISNLYLWMYTIFNHWGNLREWTGNGAAAKEIKSKWGKTTHQASSNGISITLGRSGCWVCYKIMYILQIYIRLAEESTADPVIMHAFPIFHSRF